MTYVIYCVCTHHMILNIPNFEVGDVEDGSLYQIHHNRMENDSIAIIVHPRFGFHQAVLVY